LLLTPGFITDAVGLLGLMPISRAYFIDNLLKKNAQKIFTKKGPSFVNESQAPKESNTRQKNKTLEGEFWED
jgi:UPF0716 protein FxsA